MTIILLLVGVNVSILNEDDIDINVLQKANATENAECYYFDWEMEFMGTGFGCSSSSEYCSDIIDNSSCTIYRFTGEPQIVIIGDL